MLTKSQKNYLLAIYLLGQNGNRVRTTDIADYLDVSKASTVKMTKILIEEGYILKEPYRQISLTGTGVAEANKLYTPCIILKDMLMKKAGLSDEKAENVGMVLSSELDDETLEKIVCFALSFTKEE